MSELDLPEKLCAEHIANLVDLKYHLATSDTRGVATLRGISLSSTMLDLVTVSPIQWGKSDWQDDNDSWNNLVVI